MALEIERKFLVLDDTYKHEAFSKSHIRQGYICSERGKTVRIRIRQSEELFAPYQRKEQAFITIKGPSLDGGLSRYEFEQEIPLDDAERLMSLCEPGVIDKIRWLGKLRISDGRGRTQITHRRNRFTPFHRRRGDR